MSLAGNILHSASRPARFGGRVAGRAAWGGTKLGAKGTSIAARAAGRTAFSQAQKHPKSFMAAAALAGAGVVTAQALITPNVQEALTGSPTAFQDTIRAWPSAVLFQGYNPDDRMDPLGAMHRGGDVATTSNYLYGRPVQGQLLGNMRGSPVIGSYNTGAFGDMRSDDGNTHRIRGNGRSPTYRSRGSGRNPPVDGSLVFGQYNLRR